MNKLLIGFIIIFFLAVAGYTVFELTGLFRQPTLSISFPTAGANLSEELLTLRGRAAGLVKLMVNGEPLVLDQNGDFETKLLLARGYNIIRFSSTDRFDRSVEQTLPLTYQPKITANDENDEKS